jgi:amino acid adenylation domain-containing protein
MTAVVVGSTVVEQIDWVAATSPESIAVHSSDATLTYADMAGRAEGLADHLRALGVGRGDLVALCMERSAGLVVGALGILMAGVAYVAIDPAYPDERIGWMLDDSGAVAVVCDESTATRVGSNATSPRVVLGRGGMLAEGSPRAEGDESGGPGPSDLAYVVYTSGSTGQPKGVLVEHASLSNLIEWHHAAFSLTADDRCTQIASPGFDAVIWEIWPCLAAGASLHVVPDELRTDPLGLRHWLVAKGITISFVPTAVAEGIVRLPWPGRAALRYLLTGGDALSAPPPAGLPFALVNNYGLSETAVVATSGTVPPRTEGPPSIGAPIRGVDAQVVDADLRPVVAGVAGELLIGGVAVARGYLNRPELTAERFVVDGPRRRYRTGDLVRERADGGFDFLGRLDDQLSIRGFRVEPGEVSAALNAHAGVATSVIVGSGHSGAERQLVAYVVGTGEARPDRYELADFLRATLPEYLVPGRFVWLDELPLTAHGKVDKEALAAVPEALVEAMGDHGPRTPIEDTIASVLTELLDVAEIGLDENFFLLGGHSMLGAQLIVRLENLFDVELSLRYLFDHPTLGEIASVVERQMAEAPVGSRTR